MSIRSGKKMVLLAGFEPVTYGSKHLKSPGARLACLVPLCPKNKLIFNTTFNTLWKPKYPISNPNTDSRKADLNSPFHLVHSITGNNPKIDSWFHPMHLITGTPKHPQEYKATKPVYEPIQYQHEYQSEENFVPSFGSYEHWHPHLILATQLKLNALDKCKYPDWICYCIFVTIILVQVSWTHDRHKKWRHEIYIWN